LTPLLTLIIALHTGQAAQPVEPRLMRFPAIHGDTVVFAYAGNLWVTKTSGGMARRLTSDPGQESRPFISSDGKTVAFTGEYDGYPNIYTIPIEGGEPKRLTFDPEGDICTGWAPDGKITYISTSGNFTARQFCLYKVDPAGGLPQRTVLNEVSSLSFFPDGNTIAYTRQLSFLFNWRRYRGGSQGKISFYNFATNKYWELPTKREQSFYPLVVGKELFYISDKENGVENLFRYNLDNKREAQVTHFDGADIKTPNTDGKTIVFERDGLLFLYDIATGKVSHLETTIAGEDLSARPYLRKVSGEITSLSLSPSGVRVAVEARGNIFSVPAKNGDTRNLTELKGSRARYPNWSPDGKTIAYISDQTGGYEIYTKPQLGGSATQLTSHTTGSINDLDWSPDGKYLRFAKTDNTMWLLEVATKKLTKMATAPFHFGDVDWSPDSKWIVYLSDGANHFASTYMYNVSTGQTNAVDDGTYNDSHVAFDQDGRYLYLVSSRTFHPTYGEYEFSLKVDESDRIYVIPLTKTVRNPLTVSSDEEPEEEPTHPMSPPHPGSMPHPTAPGAPKEVQVDFDGISSRILPLPLPPSEYPAIIGSSNGVFYYNAGILSRFDLPTRESTPVMTGLFGAFTMNQSRTKLAYYVAGGLGILDVHPGLAFGQGRVDLSSLEEVIDPRAEWRQMFWEAWRAERDSFYDPHFNGVDWDAVGKHYSEYLKWVDNRADLNYVIGLMIGELGTSHSYVIGGDLGNRIPQPIPVGLLGADYESVGNHIKFSKIFRGHDYDETARGPLAEPGVIVHEGDYLLAIDGIPVDGHTNPDSLLLDKVNRYVTLTVNSNPSSEGARTVRVRPVGSELNLRYYDFTDRASDYVSKMSGGKIGYMQIRDTAEQGSIDFIRGFYPQVDKEAMIVDERWNSGGYIQPWFVDTLSRKVFAMAEERNATHTPIEPAISGPKVMMINGYSGSGGDFFPWMFREAKLGPLIGERTWGGLVGINEAPNLVDGGIVTVPSFAIYDPKTGEIIAENHGVAPDIAVDQRPDKVALGEDPQLEAAVAYLLKELKDHPIERKSIDIPVVGPLGRVHHN
jgi:tricorn protease